MEKNGIWQDTIEIYAFMVDRKRKANPTAILNLLQDVAGKHANGRNLGFEDMKAKNQFWVLNRLKLEMNRWPNWKEKITIKTWIQSMRAAFSNRWFSLEDEEGNEIGSANTFWALIDATSHRPVRIPEFDVPLFPDKIAPCGNASKILPFDTTNESKSYKVTNSDLDMLGHVNNVKYIEWILNTYELAHLDKDLLSLEVNYLNQTFHAEDLAIYTNQERDGIQQHAIRRLKDDTEVCRVQMTWN